MYWPEGKIGNKIPKLIESVSEIVHKQTTQLYIEEDANHIYLSNQPVTNSTMFSHNFMPPARVTFPKKDIELLIKALQAW